MSQHRVQISDVLQVSNAGNDNDDAQSEHSGHEPVSSSDDDDQAFSDWVSENQNLACRSLFDVSTFPTIEETLEHDRKTHGVDFDAVCKGLGLDFHTRVRLVNYIRKEKPTPQDVLSFTGKEPFFGDDTYLKPVVEDDALLQFGSDDWSDDDDEMAKATEDIDPDTVGDSPEALKRQLRILRKQLEKSRQDLADYRTLVESRFNFFRDIEGSASGANPESAITEDKSLKELVEEVRHEPSLPLKSILSQSRAAIPRDDDTHYFDSYATVDIHYTMLRDAVRTSTYASFILSTPNLFKDAVVLDVGCGTGILSLFAARAGARRVIAVDASGVAEKARKVVEGAGLSDVITVLKGKVEDITLPDDIKYVDVIVSEWMGYALLYESMLDSVFAARDRFLRPPNPSIVVPPAVVYDPSFDESEEERIEREEKEERDELERLSLERQRRGGVMVPSQCRMVLAMCEAAEVWKERVEFWEDVYGYDMSVMAEDAFDETIVDIVTAESILTSTDIINDIHTQTAPLSPPPSTFTAPFTLTSTAPRRRTARAFVLYFDTFFTIDGRHAPREIKAKEVREGEGVVREVWRVGKSTGGSSRGTSPDRESAVMSPVDPNGSTEERELPGILRRKDSISSATSTSKRRRSLSRKRANTTTSRKSFDAPGGVSERQRELELEAELGLEGMHSFSTGPRSEPTHWKQAVFLLREGVVIEEGSKISGTFYCRRGEDNSRELDVEIHYRVEHPPGSKIASEAAKKARGKSSGSGELIVQTFRVR